MLRVMAASAAARAASAHRSRRAHQHADTARNRKVDSLYGARKKNEVGKTATSRTAVRACASENSSVVSAYSTMSAPRKERFETRIPARSVRPPLSTDTTRTSIGYSGKKAALPSFAR